MNINDHGFTVSVYNRTGSVTDEFMAGPAKGSKVVPTKTVKDLVASLKSPRRVFILVKAGAAVDAVISELTRALCSTKATSSSMAAILTFPTANGAYRRAQGQRRFASSAAAFPAVKEGARRGPSIMPGGDPEVT